MKGGREHVVSGRLEPQVSGVNYLLQEVLFSTGGYFASQQTFGTQPTLGLPGAQEAGRG